MNPLTILALIAGGLSADAVFVATHAGLLATPSPGSIFAEIAMSPKGALLPVLAGIAVGALVSFGVAAPIVRTRRRRCRAARADGPRQTRPGCTASNHPIRVRGWYGFFRHGAIHSET